MSWRYARLRGVRVLARCDERGELAVDKGRVEIRYRPDDRRAYRAASKNLVPEPSAEILPDETCAAASQVESQGGKPPRGKDVSGAASAKTARGCVRVSGGEIDDSESGTKSGAGTSEEVIDIYTDGACAGNPGPAGLGVVVNDGARRRELSVYLGQGTNNVAELSAIRYAAEAVAGMNRPVRIHTDSRYSIGVLIHGFKAKANTELVAAVKSALARVPDARLVYVRGHAGHEGNERADRLARQAIADRVSRGWTAK